MVATLKWAQAAEREHDVKLADALLDVSIDEVLEQSGKSLTAARPPPYSRRQGTDDVDISDFEKENEEL
jgi:ribosomal protein L12E/L44/L45/RPP1/RPP2